MKKIFIMTFAMLMTINGCKAGEQGKTAKGTAGTEVQNKVAATDKITKETRSVADFDAITLIGSYDVVYTQGTGKRVEVVAPRDMLEEIITEVKKGTLTISPKKVAGVTVVRRSVKTKGNTSSHDNVKIYVTSPELTGVTLVGSGDITSAGKLTTKTFKMMLQGSGDIDFKNIVCNGLFNATLQGSGDLAVHRLCTNTGKFMLQGSGDMYIGNAECTKADITLQGSGDLQVDNVEKANIVNTTLQGSGDLTVGNIDCAQLAVKLQNSGNLKVKKVKATIADVKIQGSGDMDINCETCKELYASVQGSGDLRLTGKTETYKRSISGSGDIRDGSLRYDNKENGTNYRRTVSFDTPRSPNGIESRP